MVYVCFVPMLCRFFFSSRRRHTLFLHVFFFFQAEDGIRDRSPSRGLGDVYKRQEYTGRERVKGYSDAMNQAGLEIPKEYCKLGGHSFEHGYRGMKELLELEDRPTGVILGNYNTMLGGIMALNESGLSCPQDVSLIGVDNLPMTQVLRPKLWLIVQPMETMCEKAVAMLLERVNGEQNGMPVKISFSTSVRAVSYTHLRAHETDSYLVCRLLLEKKKKKKNDTNGSVEIKTVQSRDE